ncbi:unnamed protein product, partial [Lactuca virosa]
ISLCRVFESLNSQFFSVSIRFSIYNRFIASSTNSNQNQVILDVYCFLLHLRFVYSSSFTRALRLFLVFFCFTLLYQSIRNTETAKIIAIYYSRANVMLTIQEAVEAGLHQPIIKQFKFSRLRHLS